jgi:hypothetical protein
MNGCPGKRGMEVQGKLAIFSDGIVCISSISKLTF